MIVYGLHPLVRGAVSVPHASFARFKVHTEAGI